MTINASPEFRTQAELTREAIRDRLKEAKWAIESGPLEGTEVVSYNDAIDATVNVIPPSSHHATDVRTPGRVVVSAVCPRCRQSAFITLELGTQLTVDSKGAELRLKGSSKAASHVCGQIAAADAGAVEGQVGAFELEDIVGETQSWSRILAELGYTVPADVIASWTLEQQAVVATWIAAQRVALEEADSPDRSEAVAFPVVPEILAEYVTEDPDAE